MSYPARAEGLVNRIKVRNKLQDHLTLYLQVMKLKFNHLSIKKMINGSCHVTQVESVVYKHLLPIGIFRFSCKQMQEFTYSDLSILSTKSLESI